MKPLFIPLLAGTLVAQMPPAQTRVKVVPNPQQPYPYDVFEVTDENKADNVQIAGTLTQPKGSDPFPVALFVQGGPAASERDGVIPGGAFKSTLVIADYFARNGIAMLRVDDRGTGGSTGDKLQSTIEQLAGDTLAGVEFVKTRTALDPRSSSFQAVASASSFPFAAARSTEVAGVISLTGPAVGMAETAAPMGNGTHRPRARPIRFRSDSPWRKCRPPS